MLLARQRAAFEDGGERQSGSARPGGDGDVSQQLSADGCQGGLTLGSG